MANAKTKLLLGIVGSIALLIVVGLAIIALNTRQNTQRQSRVFKQVIDRYFSVSADEAHSFERQLNTAIEQSVSKWVSEHEGEIKQEAAAIGDNAQGLQQLANDLNKQIIIAVQTDAQVKPFLNKTRNQMQETNQAITALNRSQPRTFASRLKITADEESCKDESGGGDHEEEHDEGDELAITWARELCEMLRGMLSGGGGHEEHDVSSDHDGQLESPTSGSSSWSIELNHEFRLVIVHSFRKAFGRHFTFGSRFELDPRHGTGTHHILAHSRIAKRKDTFEFSLFAGGTLSTI